LLIVHPPRPRIGMLMRFEIVPAALLASRPPSVRAVSPVSINSRASNPMWLRIEGAILVKAEPATPSIPALDGKGYTSNQSICLNSSRVHC
jgi:hypothetical protein